ncbi:hypothetical protein JTB14_013254 [Gonioctena quinquepunctata]|nr:hypothetical protein JTB14_013254 [Gonioctena quinquepunctata]
MRGSYDYKKISNQNIIAVKWHDNSIVTLSSNFSGVEPLHVVKRYSQKEKKNIQESIISLYMQLCIMYNSFLGGAEQPHVINMYNSNMGGVNCSDQRQNISLYRTSLRGKHFDIPLLTHSIVAFS